MSCIRASLMRTQLKRQIQIIGPNEIIEAIQKAQKLDEATPSHPRTFESKFILGAYNNVILYTKTS